MLWWGTGVLIVIVVSIVIAIVVTKNRGSEPRNQGQNQSQVLELIEEENKNKEPEEKPSEEPKKEDIKQYDGESPNKSETLTGVISYAGMSGDALIIRVNIDQYLSEGNCTLNLVQDGSVVYNEIVTIESSVSTSTCSGFQVSASKFSTDKMTVEIILESGEKYGKIMKELNI